MKVLVRMRIDRLQAETVAIKYLQVDLQQTGELEAAIELGRLNNQYMRQLFHLNQVITRLPQELQPRSRPTEGLRIMMSSNGK